jgi:hypothetical protein
VQGRRSALVAAWLAVVAGLGGGCDWLHDPPPTAGGPCRPDKVGRGKGLCADDQTFLVCDVDETFKAVPCRGPGGCRGEGPQAIEDACDVSGNASGDPCAKAHWLRAVCGADGKSSVTCGPVHGTEPVEGQEYRYEVWPCLGPTGCSEVSGNARCDMSVAEPGAPCNTVLHNKVFTCTADGGTMLVCRGQLPHQEWGVARTCRGDRGCVSGADSSALCDSTVANEGDRCQKGQVACSMDRSHMLGCDPERGVFVAEHACVKPCDYHWSQPGTFDIRCEREPTAKP